ncbi:hypothetical protein Sa4125_41610 [Aureimonas sp. SA4125]|uniref:AGROH133_08824 family phage infection protein n=1 Tax=Aureimonas sp. SA4125 TaxID=2826993 RepID=UPI001CC6E1FC|nr:DUF4345 domain-containing protein [Aureimonas sp. SA4125]BDA86619.1 hypothetical protein Sa4125_41610 [Aureimonas sp. SA4125]
MEFSLPQTNADTLAFAAAAVTALIGLFALFMPGVALRALRLAVHPNRPDAVAEARSTIGGFMLGTGVMSLLLFDQPMVQMVLGAAWLFAAFGRFVAILSDKASTVYHWLLLSLALALAAMPLAAAFGLVAS